jgi:hypothetical protein
MMLKYDVIDIEAELRDKTINIMKANELLNAELRDNYFDLVITRPDTLRFRHGNELGIISGDGTIRLIVKEGKPEKAIETFKRLINIAKKMTEFNENEELFNFDIVLILLFESKREAIDSILNFIGREKVELLSKAVNEPISAPYIGIYLREFGKPGAKEYIDIDLEPSSENLAKYWIKVHYIIQEQRGTNKLRDYMLEMTNKASSIVNMLEGEK